MLTRKLPHYVLSLIAFVALSIISSLCYAEGITQEEYDVYLAVLSNDLNRGESVVIDNRTDVGVDLRSSKDFIEKETGVKIDNEVINDFEALNKQQYNLENDKFGNEFNVYLMSPEEKKETLSKDWQLIRKKFNSHGIHTFSRVAFNNGKTLAILCHHWWLDPDGGGTDYLLFKKENNRWVVFKVCSVLIM